MLTTNNFLWTGSCHREWKRCFHHLSGSHMIKYGSDMKERLLDTHSHRETLDQLSISSTSLKQNCVSLLQHHLWKHQHQKEVQLWRPDLTLSSVRSLLRCFLHILVRLHAPMWILPVVGYSYNCRYIFNSSFQSSGYITPIRHVELKLQGSKCLSCQLELNAGRVISTPVVSTFSYNQDGDSEMFNHSIKLSSVQRSMAKAAGALESSRMGEVTEWWGSCKPSD